MNEPDTDQCVSVLVNASVVPALAEDAQDLMAFEQTAKEPALPFEEVLATMRQRGN